MVNKAANWSKELGRNVWNKFQKVLKKVMEAVKKQLKKIANMGKKMFEAVMAFFNVEISNTRGIVTDISL